MTLNYFLSVDFCYLQSRNNPHLVKFIYSDKATKFCEISTVDLSYVETVKSTIEVSQNFVASSEYTNFNKKLEVIPLLGWETKFS